MKKIIYLLSILVAIPYGVMGQINYEKGYFITNDGTVTNCLIEDVEWKNNPVIFEYKLTESSGSQIGKISSVQEFGIKDVTKYRRFDIQIDMSSDNIDELSKSKEPEFEIETAFLQVLVEGMATLYVYVNGNIRWYYMQMDNDSVRQLVNKRYVDPEESDEVYKKIYYNEDYKQQLYDQLKCSNFSSDDFEKLKYNKEELIRLFVAYNECIESGYVSFEKVNSESKFNFAIRPGISYSSLLIESPAISIYRNPYGADFGSQVTWRLGIEAEYILPFNKNKWRIILEPTYQYFTGNDEVHLVWRDTDSVKVSYNSIDMPIGLRYNMFLNDKLSVFTNVSGVFVLDFNSSRLEYGERDDMEINSNVSAALGIGVNFNDRISAEFRYHTTRSVLAEVFWNDEYNTMQFIVGYTLFKTGK